MRIHPYYDHAGITIYCRDFIEVMPSLDLVDALVTDPPFGEFQRKIDDELARKITEEAKLKAADLGKYDPEVICCKNSEKI